LVCNTGIIVINNVIIISLSLARTRVLQS